MNVALICRDPLIEERWALIDRAMDLVDGSRERMPLVGDPDGGNDDAVDDGS
jgi:hypothetical protein